MEWLAAHIAMIPSSADASCDAILSVPAPCIASAASTMPVSVNDASVTDASVTNACVADACWPIPVCDASVPMASALLLRRCVPIRRVPNTGTSSSADSRYGK